MIRDALPARPEARRLILGVLLSAIGTGMTLPFLYVYLTKVRHLDSTVVGLVVGWMGVLALILSGPGGTLIDRFGVRRVILPLYLADAVGIASYAFVHSTWQAFGSATLASIGGVNTFAASNTLMSSVTGEEERQRAFGLSFATLNLGIGAGGIVAGFIADVHHPASFRVLYLTNAAAVLLPAIVLMSMPHVGHRLVAEDQGGTESGGYREVFADRAFRRFVIFALLITACGYAQIEVGLPAFATVVGGTSTRVIAWALAANTMTIVAAQLLVLRRMQGRSRSRALAVVGLIIALSWLILGLGAMGRHVSPVLPVVAVIACASVFACGETIMSPVMPAITNALAPDELRGRYNAMSSMIWGVTGVVGPVTAAPLIGHHLGEVWVVLIVGGSLVAALVALSMRSLLTPEQDGTTADEPVPTEMAAERG